VDLTGEFPMAINTERLKKFAAEYSIDLSVKESAKRCGVSLQTGYAYLHHPLVQEILRNKRNHELKRVQGTAENIVRELEAIAFANLRNAIGPSGEALNPNEMADEASKALAGWELNAKGEVKVKHHDKTKALELLGKRLGLWEPDASKDAGAKVTINIGVKKGGDK